MTPDPYWQKSEQERIAIIDEAEELAVIFDQDQRLAWRAELQRNYVHAAGTLWELQDSFVESDPAVAFIMGAAKRAVEQALQCLMLGRV